MRKHKPVLLKQAVEKLNCHDGGFYVDCTLGMGGHAQEILKVSSPGGILLGFDRDAEAVRIATALLASFHDRVRIIHDDFRKLPHYLKELQAPQLDGVLADLGPSLLQFTSPERGFSFQQSGPLDMRMDQRQSLTAETIVQTSSYEELRNMLREFGEEPAAGRIAQRIIAERQKQPVRTTGELAAIVESVKRKKPGDKIHPATQTFQALRIVVNAELEKLDQFLFDAFDALKTGGRLVVIAFHSLEDRIVKQAFQFLSAACRCPRRLLECRCGGKPLSILLTRKPVTADSEEVQENPASRSARLRAVEKIASTSQRELWADWRSERS